MWHRVAPALAEEFTVICADLRGYGLSGKPPMRPDHAAIFEERDGARHGSDDGGRGISRFSVVGHDRGGRVAYRMALEHVDRIERLALLDIIPTGEAFRRADFRFALAYWPWSLLAQPEPLPERLIVADPETVIDDALGVGSDPTSFPPEFDRLHRGARGSQYRARDLRRIPGGGHDRLREGYGGSRRRLADACPTLVLWSTGEPSGYLVRRSRRAARHLADWAADVTGSHFRGPFLCRAELKETIAELRSFFRPVANRRPPGSTPKAPNARSFDGQGWIIVAVEDEPLFTIARTLVRDDLRMLAEQIAEGRLRDAAFEPPQHAALQEPIHRRAREAKIGGDLRDRKRAAFDSSSRTQSGAVERQ